MTTLPLARFEAAQLLRHPSMVVGALLTALALWLVWGEDPSGDVLMHEGGTNVGLAFVLFAFAVLVGANLSALRARRHGAVELLASLPMPEASRTSAHLLSVGAVVPLVAGVVLAVDLVWQRRPMTIGHLPLEVAATVLLLVVGAGATGVLVARWAPHPAAGAAAVIAIFVLQLNFRADDVHLRWLHFVSAEAYDTPFDIEPVAWHLVYLAALIALAVVLAVARSGFGRRVSLALGVVVAVLVLSGWMQTRPASTSAVAARADELERPEAHRVCEERGGVAYCAYPDYRPWAARWVAPVEGVLRRVPADVRARPLRVSQRVTPSVQLIPALRAAVDAERAWPDDGQVHPGFVWWVERHELGLAYQAGAWAVGLPSAVGLSDACSAGGQARVVVAMWFAGQATPEGRRSLRTRAASVERDGRRSLVALHPLDVADQYESDRPFVPEVGSAGRGADVVAAAALLDLPDDRVAAAVTEHWARFTDPTTPAAAVFAAVGVPAPAVADLPPVTPGVGGACR